MGEMDESLVGARGVTVVIARRVKPGREAEYETWLDAVVDTMKRFPGFLGFENLRPVQGLQLEHVLLLRFDTEADLRRWEMSPERARWLAQGAAFTEHLASIQRISGLEGLFTPPRTRVSLAPPRWKMFLVVSLGLYPLVLLTGLYVAPPLAFVSLPPRLALTTLLNVALMTWAVMPALTWSLRSWLTPVPA
jgi:uncharacterized protein